MQSCQTSLGLIFSLLVLSACQTTETLPSNSLILNQPQTMLSSERPGDLLKSCLGSNWATVVDACTGYIELAERSHLSSQSSDMVKVLESRSVGFRRQGNYGRAIADLRAAELLKNKLGLAAVTPQRPQTETANSGAKRSTSNALPQMVLKVPEATELQELARDLYSSCWERKPQTVIDVCTRLIELAEREKGLIEPIDLVTAYENRSEAQKRRGAYDLAEQDAKSAATIQKSLRSKHHDEEKDSPKSDSLQAAQLAEVQCYNALPAIAIAACTRVIESGVYEGQPITKYRLSTFYMQRGILYSRQNNTDKAMQDLDLAIKTDDQNAQAVTERALLNNNGSAGSMAMLGQRNLFGQPPVLREQDKTLRDLGKANTLIRQKRYDAALESVNQTIEEFPRLSVAHTMQGYIYSKTQKLEQAMSSYDRALELDPRSFAALGGKGNIYFIRKEYTDAIRFYDRAINVRPNDSITYFNRGLVYTHLNKPDRALADYTRTLDLQPNQYKALNNRGAIYMMLRLFERALLDLNRAIEQKSDDPMSYGNRARTFLALGRPDKAIRDFNRAIDLAPSNANSYAGRGLAYLLQKRLEMAARDFNKARELGYKGSLFKDTRPPGLKV